jgi:hypothetical protein
MSSHREAPGISKDPCADNTDTYAFRTPNNTVTIVANYLPGQEPSGGPNFYEFDDDVLYTINIDNDGDGRPNVAYEFSFETVNTNENTFLYNTGPIGSLTDPNWNRRQTYKVVKVKYEYDRRRRRWNRDEDTIGRNIPAPPCNIGPRSTPNYPNLANAAIKSLEDGERVFCGQRADSFYVDLGSVFDLGTLRPFQDLHLIPTAKQPGVDSLAQTNVHSIVLEIPIGEVTVDGRVPTDVMSSKSVIGVWASASRQKATIRDDDLEDGYRSPATLGNYVQVSRLGNPLFNEVIVPLDEKDAWNAVGPDKEKFFAKYVRRPELAALLPVLYPGVFPNLKAYDKDRVDLVAILLTGIPKDVIGGFQNFTGETLADELRLNLAIPISSNPKRRGLLDGDLQGFPNGRRLADDVVTIELQAVAGATIPLVDNTFTPDGAATVIEDGTFPPVRQFLSQFPYVGHPYAGYDVP